MDRPATPLKAFLAGVGSVFALLPAPIVHVRQPIAVRMHNNFARVGLRLDSACIAVSDEQKKQAKQGAR